MIKFNPFTGNFDLVGEAGTSSSAPDASTTVKGLVQLAGDLAGTAASPTVPGLAGKANTTHVHSAADITTGTLPTSRGGTGTTSNVGTGSLVFATSPTFAGIPTAPTATAGTNTTQLATTAFVTTAVAGAGGGSGDVVGPASSNDEGVVRFDGTTGKLVQDSLFSINDFGGMTIAGTGGLYATGAQVELRQAGDNYGATSLKMQNRVGSNGALFTNEGLGLTDLGFSNTSGYQMNFRYEARNDGSIDVRNAPYGELQIIDNSTSVGGSFSFPMKVGRGVAAFPTQDVVDIGVGDLQVSTNGKGLVQKSPDGTLWRLSVSNTGVPSWATV